VTPDQEAACTPTSATGTVRAWGGEVRLFVWRDQLVKPSAGVDVFRLGWSRRCAGLTQGRRDSAERVPAVAAAASVGGAWPGAGLVVGVG
jgi:hypothetical protein